MATRQRRKAEPPKAIEAISRFAGTLVGTAMATGKQIIKTAASASKKTAGKPKKKSVRAPSKRKKKAARKTKPKVSKIKKKKAVKRKITGSSGKSGASKKKSVQSPAKKKGTTRTQKTSAKIIEQGSKPESEKGG